MNEGKGLRSGLNIIDGNNLSYGFKKDAMEIK